MKTVLENYNKKVYSLSFADADRIYSTILSDLDLQDEDDRDMYNTVMDGAKKYCEIRVDWNTLSLEERVQEDSKRTSVHNSFINKINMLARYLKNQKGKDISWRKELGDLEKDPSYRKRIGDFACYMVLFAGLMGR